MLALFGDRDRMLVDGKIEAVQSILIHAACGAALKGIL